MTLRHALCYTLLLPLAALAASSNTPPLPAPLQLLQQQGFQLKHPFNQGGLQGYVAEYQGEGTTVFLTPDQQHVIVGNLINSQGENLTDAQVNQYVYAPQSKANWQQLANSHYIAAGHGPRIIYAFFDPYCPYCSDFWQQAQPWITSGKIQLRVLLVPILRRESATRAAAILQAADPAKTLHDYENSRWKITPPAPKTITPASRKQLQANLQLMNRLKAAATPAIYYQDRDGQLREQLGLPQNDVTLQAVMGGQP